MHFHTFAEYLNRLETITSRLEITAILADLFKDLKEEETTKACYLLQGQLLPPYENLEFQIAIKTAIKALARLLPAEKIQNDTLFAEPDYSVHEHEVERLYREAGDLGVVAENIVKTQHTQLSLEAVYDHLWQIAQEGGAQSQQRKLNGVVDLLKKVDAVSAKFIIRILLGRLRY
jgi:DNA ligase 1